MKLPLRSLKESIRKVKVGISTKDLVEELTHLSFINGNIVAYNDKLCVISPFPQIEDNFSIKAQDFQKMLDSFSDEEIKFEIKTENEKHTVKLSSKDTISEIEVNKDLRVIEEVFDSFDLKKGFKKLKTKEFMRNLGLVSFSADKSISEQNLHCVALKDGLLMSTDGLRFSLYEIEEDLEGFLIPADSANKVSHVEATHVKIENDWAIFKDNGGTFYACRNVAGEYPDLKEYVKGLSFKEEVYEFPKGTQSLINSISFMCDGDTPFEKSVTVSMSPKGLVITARKSNGYIKKKLKAKYKKEVVFQINPDALYDILSITNEVMLSKENDMAKLSSDNFTHIMRIAIR